MATPKKRAPVDEMPGNDPKHFETDERRRIMADALDHAMHALQLSYVHEDDSMRQTLALEAIMWSNVMIAEGLQELTRLYRLS